MSRIITPFNRDWEYAPSFRPQYIDQAYQADEFQLVSLPHMNQEIPYNYFDEKSYQFVSCYRKHFTVASSSLGKRVFIDFEGVMTYAKVYINGNYLGEHKGGYTPFSFDLTPHIQYDGENLIVVMVDSTERADIPPFGFVIDYLTYGGIYREVSLRIVNPLHIHHVFSKTSEVLSLEKQVEAAVFVQNTSHTSSEITALAQLFDANGQLLGSTEQAFLINEVDTEIKLNLKALKNIHLWDLDTPELYSLKISLMSGNETLDAYETKIGFRTAQFTENGFLLNGNPVKIRGLNRHQAFPYVGYAVPKRVQEKDADILKFDLHLNTVRTSHYPQSTHFLNRCDEIGLLVFEELPGWQHIGDEAWQAVACENVREMITRDFNHPSIILWGVRINESPDDHDFFTKTNQIAHELDETRQTGGVRAITHSELLEDVYTMNDFIQGNPADHRILRPQMEITGLPHNVPYLVTEFNGHMYPTKRFDQEERLNEHALRHLKVHNSAALDPHKSGAIGWCAFDYNTHFEFGSGDRICYHGVMDMFRIPKYAAAFYKSQISPDTEIVMEAVSRYARGERDQCIIAPLTIFTNCDYIKLFIGENFVGTYYPAKDRYAGVSYPPVIFDVFEGQWGMAFENMTIIGFKSDQEVAKETFAKNPLPTKLSMLADDAQLNTGDMDSTRIIFKLLDQQGHELPYCDGIVTVSVEGPAELIGPSTFSLIGGCRGAWIKTSGTAGTLVIKAICSGLEAEPIYIKVQ